MDHSESAPTTRARSGGPRGDPGLASAASGPRRARCGRPGQAKAELGHVPPRASRRAAAAARGSGPGQDRPWWGQERAVGPIGAAPRRGPGKPRAGHRGGDKGRGAQLGGRFGLTASQPERGGDAGLCLGSTSAGATTPPGTGPGADWGVGPAGARRIAGRAAWGPTSARGAGGGGSGATTSTGAGTGSGWGAGVGGGVRTGSGRCRSGSARSFRSILSFTTTILLSRRRRGGPSPHGADPPARLCWW